MYLDLLRLVRDLQPTVFLSIVNRNGNNEIIYKLSHLIDSKIVWDLIFGLEREFQIDHLGIPKDA